MKKVIHPIDIKPQYRQRFMPVFCKIEYEDGSLSITGVEGPNIYGNCSGGCGQIVMDYKGNKNDNGQIILTRNKVIHISKFNDKEYRSETEIRYSSGWDYKTFKKFIDLWDKWHLNDLKAGTPMQEAFLEEHKDEFPGYPTSHYSWATELLNNAGLNPAPDKEDYKYGSAWLKESVPQDVIDFLFSLPNTDRTPAWV